MWKSSLPHAQIKSQPATGAALRATEVEMFHVEQWHSQIPAANKNAQFSALLNVPRGTFQPPTANKPAI
jgi:hypothetical protein